MLLATGNLYKQNLISLEEKNWIKNVSFQGFTLIYCALEAFLADEQKDWSEFAENIHLMFELANDPQASNIFC